MGSWDWFLKADEYPAIGGVCSYQVAQFRDEFRQLFLDHLRLLDDPVRGAVHPDAKRSVVSLGQRDEDRDYGR